MASCPSGVSTALHSLVSSANLLRVNSCQVCKWVHKFQVSILRKLLKELQHKAIENTQFKSSTESLRVCCF